MNFSFSYFSLPVEYEAFNIVTLSIESNSIYRSVLQKLYNEEQSEEYFSFSDCCKPLEYKKNVCVINNIFQLEFSSAFMKKIYSEMAQVCCDFFLNETTAFKAEYENLIDKLMSKYEYDFTYSIDFDIAGFLKFRSVMPDLTNGSLAERLINYMVLVSKYSSIKLFIVPNLHLLFSKDELEAFYKDVELNNIKLLVIENSVSNACTYEKICILDTDMCEIL